jgi:hypothetical protein
MGDFAGWPVRGISPSGIPCFNPLFCLGLIRVRAKSASPLTRAVSMFPSRRFDATSFGSRPVAAAPKEVAVAAQLQGWMLAWGIRGACQIISEHFWIDGGDCGEPPPAVLTGGACRARGTTDVLS